MHLIIAENKNQTLIYAYEQNDCILVYLRIVVKSVRHTRTNDKMVLNGRRKRMWNYDILTKFYEYHFGETRKKRVKTQSATSDFAANIRAQNLQNTMQACQLAYSDLLAAYTHRATTNTAVFRLRFLWLKQITDLAFRKSSTCSAWVKHQTVRRTYIRSI